ncbi:hypothetical protein MVEN_01716300 [Mycena venus]|uniref:Protein kinase domain-containing protein n=1 Tax=Mycena venus TaxID=2733690 RepID=A0A8H6XM73_9AGAR|nr:hypothetical protein MVEN_01716300 [Mycena venus]
MEEDPPSEPQTTDDGDGQTAVRYTSAFFAHPRHFAINGGSFINTNINHAAPSEPPDFRMIPIGDLNLLREIRHDGGSGVIDRRKRRAPVRRMYTARITGSQSAVTAVMFQGEGAEEQCRAAISQYITVRHPNILQLYGLARTRGLHAAVFHDDLIPYKEVREKYCHSHFSTVFFWACMKGQLQDARGYVSSIWGRKPYWRDYTPWIRLSTGLLIIELTPPHSMDVALYLVGYGLPPSRTSLLNPPPATEIITSMSLNDYHNICSWDLDQLRNFTISTHVPIRLGSIRQSSGAEYENSFEIAFASNWEAVDHGWRTEDLIVEGCWTRITLEEGTSILENGWTRVNSADVADEYLRRIYSKDSCSEGWIAQANHIFNSLNIKSDFENHFLVHGIQCWLRLSGLTKDLPPGYLFLCPFAEFEADVLGCFELSECPAYWSHDASGTECLSKEEARNLGFPDINFEMTVAGLLWDSSIYDGVHQFHEAKGFDPYSQEVAIELGYPLFEISCIRDDLLAHLREDFTDDGYSESDREFGNEEFPESPTEDDAQDEDSAMELRYSKNAARHDADSVTTVRLSHHLDEAEKVSPSRSLNIIIRIQLALILLASVFALYDSL